MIQELGKYNGICNTCGKIFCINKTGRKKARKKSDQHIEETECNSITIEQIKPQTEKI